MNEKDHLDEDQIMWAIVDEGELPMPVRNHLFRCSTCRARWKQLQADLVRLGKMAEQFAPSPQRRVVLPQEETKGRRPWLWNWRISLAGGVVATGIILVALWFGPLTTVPKKGATTLVRETWEDAGLMAEISKLEESALSPIHREITGESVPIIDEEFIGFVVPSLEDVT